MVENPTSRNDSQFFVVGKSLYPRKRTIKINRKILIRKYKKLPENLLKIYPREI